MNSRELYDAAGHSRQAPQIVEADVLKERASAECDTADRRGKRCGCGTLGVVSAEIEPVCLQGNMRVSIIVPTLNEASHIVGTIRSLQRLSSEKEIIVVDGGSTDQTASLACAQNVLVLEAAKGEASKCTSELLNQRGMSSGFFMLTPFLRHMLWSISVKVLKQDLQSVVISACCSMAHRELPGSLLPSTRCCASLVYTTTRINEAPNGG